MDKASHVGAGLLSLLAVTKTCQFNHLRVTPCLEPRRGDPQIPGSELGIAIHHLTRLEAAHMLQLAA